MVFKLECESESCGMLAKAEISRINSQRFLVDLRCSWKFCISITFPGDVNAASVGPHIKKHSLNDLTHNNLI